MKVAVSGFFVALATLVIWGSSGACSQELMPLAQWLQRPASDQEQSYPFVRCAGYYMGLLKYAGSAISEEQQSSFVQAATRLAFTAAKIRHAKAASRLALSEFVEHARGDVERTADEYVKRMQRNYSRSGNAFVDDSLVKGDGQFCKELAQELMAK